MVIGTGSSILSRYGMGVVNVPQVTPFTYRDGATYLEILHTLTHYVQTGLLEELDAGLVKAIEELNTGLMSVERFHADYSAEIDRRILLISNRVGPEGIQRITLTGNFVLDIDPVWPDAHALRFQVTNDDDGGHLFWLGEGISGELIFNDEPNAVNDFLLVPRADGTWTVENVNGLGEDQILEILGAFETKIEGDIAQFNTSVNTRLGKKRQVVTTLAELQAAIAVGGDIFVDGVISLNGGVEINRPCRIYGGSYTMTDGEHGFNITSNDVTLDGGVYSGSGTDGPYRILQRFILCVGTTGNYRRNIVITNNRMDGSAATNILLRYVRQTKITGNTISNFLYSGIMLLSCEEFVVDSNVIYNAVMKSPVVNVYGIGATDSDNIPAYRSRNGVISNNMVNNIPWEGIDTHGGEHIAITGNSLRNCVRGIALVVGNESRNLVPLHITVTGNTLNGVGSLREGISLFGKSGVSPGASAIISGNSITGYETPIYVTAFGRTNSYIGGNSAPFIPWTNIDLANGWQANSANPPQYKVDGHTTSLRGQAIPPIGVAKPAGIGTIPSAYAPSGYGIQMLGYAKGSDVAAGDFTLGVRSSGVLTAFYPTGSDSFSYPISGSFDI